MTTPTRPSPADARPPRPTQRSMWGPGIVAGALVTLAAYWIPASPASGSTDAGPWFLLTLLQFATTITETGWSVLGLAAALLAAVVALVAFVGTRDATFQARSKRDATRDVAGWLILVATALASAGVLAFLLVPVFSIVFVGSIAVETLDAETSDQVQRAMAQQINGVLIGFTSLGLIGAARLLDKAVYVWDVSDEDELAAERILVEKRIETRESSLTDAQTETIDSPRPRGAAVGMTAAWTTGAAVLATTVFIVARAMADTLTWDAALLSFFFGCLVVGALQSLIVAATTWDWRAARWSGPSVALVTDASTGTSAPTKLDSRWKRKQVGQLIWLIATACVIPAAILAGALASEIAPWSRAMWTMSIVAFIVLAATPLWIVLARGHRSWDQAVRASTIRAMTKLIETDRARLDDLLPPFTRLWRRLRAWLI